VAKSAEDIRLALEARIQCLNVESAAELVRVNDIAGDVGYPAPVALRINPDVDAGAHPYIATGLAEAKFGIPIGDAQEVYREAVRMPHLQVTGVAAHIGSQIDRLEPFVEALRRVLDFTQEMARAGLSLSHLDLGGGLGIAYREERVPRPQDHVAALVAELTRRGLRLPVIVEPGRSIVGPAGVLLTRVEYLKANGARRFAVVDAGMNDLIRPALYEAWHRIVPVAGGREQLDAPPLDVVGPVCESGDVLGRDRHLAVRGGDLLAVMAAGAYGFAMSSNYNARPRAAEILVDGTRALLVRRRETFNDLIRGERLLPD
jgi:diaminopimelate decarboxylase